MYFCQSAHLPINLPKVSTSKPLLTIPSPLQLSFPTALLCLTKSHLPSKAFLQGPL